MGWHWACPCRVSDLRACAFVAASRILPACQCFSCYGDAGEYGWKRTVVSEENAGLFMRES
jgi:hypothetical protein